MTTYKTGNPIGSANPKDLYDNSQNLDEAVNSQESTWKDRFGVVRPTLKSAVDPTGLVQEAVGAAERAEEAADIAEHIASMGTYLTKTEADAALPKPKGTVIRVTNDPDPANNGYWVSDGSQWIWSGVQPVSVTALAGISDLAAAALELASSPAIFNGDFATEAEGYDSVEFAITGPSGRSIASFYADGGWAFPWQGEFATEAVNSAIAFAFVSRKTGHIFLAFDAAGNSVVGGGVNFDSLPKSREILPPGSTYLAYKTPAVLPETDSFVNEAPWNFAPTTEVLYGLIDDLVSEFPDYLEKTVLGQDSVGNDILMIRAVPAGYWTRWYPENAPEALRKPKVVLLGSTHGSEKLAAVANYQFLRAICESWKEDERLGFLRWGMELVYIPVVTPSGYNDSVNGNYLNANGVNINRNYPTGWEGSADPNKGPSAASEIETQLMLGVFAQESDACVIIDHHNAGSLNAEPEPYAVWLGTETGKTIEIARLVADHMMMYVRREFPAVDQSNSKITRIVDSFDGSCAKHVQIGMGFAGFTLETGSGIPVGGQINNQRANQIHAVETITTLIFECVKNENERRKRETVLPNE
ncbi:M14 family zinc carboxypeptidase [Alcaligenes faecalis]|uniref:M14 family zinc carboxypeptidase n=1 Tax=Alcaligenes faecalis TaxID=511 RepID=UPI003F7C7F6B